MSYILDEAYRLFVKYAAEILTDNGITKKFLEDRDVSVIDVIVDSVTGENPKLKDIDFDCYSQIIEYYNREIVVTLEDAYEYLSEHFEDDEEMFISEAESFGTVGHSELNEYQQKQKSDGYTQPIWMYMDKYDVISLTDDIVWRGNDSLDWQLDERTGFKIWKLLK